MLIPPRAAGRVQSNVEGNTLPRICDSPNMHHCWEEMQGSSTSSKKETPWEGGGIGVASDARKAAANFIPCLNFKSIKDLDLPRAVLHRCTVRGLRKNDVRPWVHFLWNMTRPQTSCNTSYTYKQSQLLYFCCGIPSISRSGQCACD